MEHRILLPSKLFREFHLYVVSATQSQNIHYKKTQKVINLCVVGLTFKHSTAQLL